MRAASRAVSSLLALALLALGILTAVEIVAAPFRSEPVALPWDRWYETGVDNTWGASVVRTTSVVLLLAGLALLALALAKRPPESVPLEPQRSSVRARLHRASLERSLRRCVEVVDGVAKARTRMRTDRVTVAADARRRDTGPIQQKVAAMVDRRLNDIPLERRPAVSVDVRAKEVR